jgi:hypothetical protein
MPAKDKPKIALPASRLAVRVVRIAIGLLDPRT